jgi:D-alanyl-D-alanine carboxypeptidase/D-alanyl-D-alanine-endopeptidase (penicillin-binding protein 4)
MTRARALPALALVGLLATVSCTDSSAQPSAKRDSRAASAAAPAPAAPLATAAPATAVPACTPDPTLVATPVAPVPPTVGGAVDAFATNPAVAAGPFGVSIWIDGYGEVARQPDDRLLPASNQKLLTAMGALSVLGTDAQFTTEVRATAAGGLVIVGGGDPTLTARGPHSLDALAAQVRATGIEVVSGAVAVDESRHANTRRPSGWQDWQVPAYAGPLSALMVDRNRYRGDADFLGDPALANADLFRAALERHGVRVAGPVVHGAAPADAPVVARLASASVGTLVTDTLLRSDNMAAEQILREVGRAASGVGSTPAGAAAAKDALAPLCVPVVGADDDGSGLSRANARSAREWRALLQAARSEPWWPGLFGALPEAGRSGTLSGRFRGTPAEANVRAKTGTIIGGIALSGYGTTRGGRDFVFSVIANGPASNGAQPALDTLIAAIAADAS